MNLEAAGRGKNTPRPCTLIGIRAIKLHRIIKIAPAPPTHRANLQGGLIISNDLEEEECFWEEFIAS